MLGNPAKWNRFQAKKLSRATHNFHMQVWWIFSWPVNKDSSSSKRNSAFQKVCQPARCSPHGASTGTEKFRWASGPAVSIWCIRRSPKPFVTDEDTGSPWVFSVQAGGEPQTCLSTLLMLNLWLFTCSPIERGPPKTTLQILCIS